MRATLNRFDLFRFEKLVSKIAKPADRSVIVTFETVIVGLQLAAFCDGAVLSLTVPFDDDVESFALPFATVKEFSTKKNGSVDVEVSNGNVTFSWMASGILQTKTVQSLDMADKIVILDDAILLRNNLRETLGNLNGLIKSLKSQRRQDKLLHEAVASLRKLQNI